MLHDSSTAILMVALSCGGIMAFAAICYTNKKLFVSMNYEMFSLLPGITILHLTLPFKFSPIAALPDSLSRIIAYLNDPFFTVGSLNISIWRVFGLIWAVGSVICLVKFIRDI